MTADLVYLVAGGALLLAVVLPQLLRHWAISAPMVLVVVGMLIGLTPLPDGMPLDPQDNRATIEHVTELTVLIALMGVGLAIDRPLNLLRRSSWGGWSPTWRLLVVAMPLTVGAVALLGWWVAGLAPAVALLLGAVLSPTDPVLASDVQVAGPRTGDDHEVDGDDEVRFGLTSEAGLNDGLAFPFVYAAILLATEGAVGGWAWEWVGFYLVGKVVIGVLVGLAVGWALARVAFRGRRTTEAPSVAERGESLLVLAALVSAYGVGEVVGGYGFLSVFVCAMTLRSAERGHEYHKAMHEVVERLERLFTLFVLLVLGIALTRGLLATLDWRGVLVGVSLVLVVRPLAGYVALAPWARHPDEVGGMTTPERWAVSFFGVRGVGSLFYLAYAAGESGDLGADWLWSTVAFTIVLSVMLHGVLATPVMKRLDHARGRAADSDRDVGDAPGRSASPLAS
ncbi:cation transporter [Marmoricola sp. Leaf446]|uniref:cation:proton antiporter n=1 Tax=Marmoricola sp. Leaf446 TaxID=1736379 RepID=UPI0006FC0C9D|nr:cation:proton antiporter [Marmoricola sp. Leaf446]KQT93550.1 cation transporter [Marmoricola sp. Leaf446]